MVKTRKKYKGGTPNRLYDLPDDTQDIIFSYIAKELQQLTERSNQIRDYLNILSNKPTKEEEEFSENYIVRRLLQNQLNRLMSLRNDYLETLGWDKKYFKIPPYNDIKLSNEERKNYADQIIKLAKKINIIIPKIIQDIIDDINSSQPGSSAQHAQQPVSTEDAEQLIEALNRAKIDEERKQGGKKKRKNKKTKKRGKKSRKTKKA